MTNLALRGLLVACAACAFACGSGGNGSGGGATTGGGGIGGGAGKGGIGGGSAGSGGGSGVGGSSGRGGGKAGGGGGTGGGTGSACTPACATARECCAGSCVNVQNDPRNCGTCAHSCDASTYCAEGTCVAPPCMTSCSGGQACCGASCCTQGQICCEDQGPVSRGATCVTPDASGTCPAGCAPLCKCTSPDTRIATPNGERAIATLEVGDLVYSVDRGVVKVVPIVQVHHIAAVNHTVMRVTLATGAVLEISPGHPTTDGRTFAELRAGDALDGVAIVHSEPVPFTHAATYDILPDSDSGAYFAGGVLVGSTLALRPAQVRMPSAPASIMPVVFGRSVDSAGLSSTLR